MANNHILTEDHLVNFYIKEKMAPYDHSENHKKTYLKEYKIEFGGEKRRVDLLIHNENLGRIDLIEFKNKPIELRDIFQISNYYYLFLKQFPEHENCSYTHLIAKSANSRKIDSLLTIGFDKLKVWYFWPHKNGVDIYDQDREITLML